MSPELGTVTLNAYVDILNRQQDRDTALLDRQTRLRPLEELGVHLLFIFNTGRIVLPDNAPSRVLLSLIVKLTNELFAFCGCMRASALWGSYHHLRTLMELRGALHYLYSEANETPRRVEQFLEFERMAPWQRYRGLELARDKGIQHPGSKGSITQAEFDRVNLVSAALIAHATPAQVDKWKALWGHKDERKLVQDQHQWHEGSIRSLLLKLDPTGAKYRAYEVLCHATHISPLGHRLTGWGPMQLLGFGDETAKQAINSMGSEVYFALKTINDILGGALDSHLAGPIGAFVADGPHDSPIATTQVRSGVDRPSRQSPRSHYRQRQYARRHRPRGRILGEE